MAWKDMTSLDKAKFLEDCAVAVFVAAGLVFAATIIYFAPWPFKIAFAGLTLGALLSLGSNYYTFR